MELGWVHAVVQDVRLEVVGVIQFEVHSVCLGDSVFVLPVGCVASCYQCVDVVFDCPLV